jgi:predicted XRE-type DNA-binding protein
VPKKRETNVFDDLGFSTHEADVLTMKAELHSKIVRCAKHYSQGELQRILHVSQPRISDLLRGKIARFSLETLIDYAQALKMRPEIRTHEPAETLAPSRA